MVTRTDWWLDDIPEQAKASNALAPTLQSDQAVFVEYADDAKTKARVRYPTDSENVVAAPVAPGVYSAGATCPVVLASDGRISGVLLPISPGEGEPQPTGELGQDQLAARNAAGLISDMGEHLDEMDTKLTQVQTDVSTIETQMGPIQAQVDQIPAIRQQAKAALNNLQIGGRNLVIGSDAWAGYQNPPIATGGYNYTFSIPPLTGAFTYKIYPTDSDIVLQLEVKADGPDLLGVDLIWQSNGVNKSISPVTLSETWQRLVSVPIRGSAIGLRTLPAAGGRLLARNFKVERGNKATDWTPAPEDVDASIQAAATTALQAQDSAVSAGNVANMARQIALSLIYTGPVTPAPDPTAYQIWFVTAGDDDAVKSIAYSDGAAWGPHTTLTGMLIVPGPDGPTVIDGSGVNTAKVLADVIASQFAAFGMVSAEMLQIVPRSKLDGAAQDSLDAADELDKRITLADGTVTISQRPKGGEDTALTALILQPTKLDFVVNGQVVGYMDSERQQLYIQNINMPGKAMLGEHLVSTDDQHRLNFNWVGRVV